MMEKIRNTLTLPEKVYFFDTTLRDGEQTPGISFTHEEKLSIAEALSNLGIDIIEAGFPITSEGDFAACRDIAKAIQYTRRSALMTLTRKIEQRVLFDVK